MTDANYFIHYRYRLRPPQFYSPRHVAKLFQTNFAQFPANVFIRRIYFFDLVNCTISFETQITREQLVRRITCYVYNYHFCTYFSEYLPRIQGTPEIGNF